MDSNTLVICGHGMVAQRLLERLHDGGHPFSRIVVLGAEPDAAYNRVLLSSVLAGEATMEQIRLKEDNWFEAAGIRGRSAHSLRHTFATGLLAKTGDLRLVQSALGHKSIISTTVYAQCDRGRLRAAVGA